VRIPSLLGADRAGQQRVDLTRSASVWEWPLFAHPCHSQRSQLRPQGQLGQPPRLRPSASATYSSSRGALGSFSGAGSGSDGHLPAICRSTSGGRALGGTLTAHLRQQVVVEPTRSRSTYADVDGRVCSLGSEQSRPPSVWFSRSSSTTVSRGSLATMRRDPAGYQPSALRQTGGHWVFVRIVAWHQVSLLAPWIEGAND
jgi:hypothetical protein